MKITIALLFVAVAIMLSLFGFTTDNESVVIYLLSAIILGLLGFGEFLKFVSKASIKE